jgi:glycosyltransferase involved in cell wall biosynthesis
VKKILIGFSNTAGLSSRYKKAFEEIGYVTDFYSFSKHPFGYSTHKILRKFNNRLLNYISSSIYCLKFLIKYDYFIFISGAHLFNNFLDLRLYRFFGKKTMVIFTGCDVQQPELIKANKKIAYSSCHNCPEEYMKFVQCEPLKKIVQTRLIEKYFDVIMCHFMNSDSLEREYHQVFVPIDIEALSKYINTAKNLIPVILHAPSNAQYKGTSYLKSAIERLRNEGYVFEFRLVQNVPIEQLYEEIGKSDLVVDQLIQGWYGLLPMEAMAINKPVICYMREELLSKLPNDCPIINANPETIYNVLKYCLDNKNYLQEKSKAGSEYVKRYHNSIDIAKSLISYFEVK